MRYKTLKEMIESIRTFAAENPTAFIRIKDEPTILHFGFEAIGETEEDNKSWSTSIMSLKRERDTVLTEGENAIVSNYITTRSTFDKAEREYINMFTGRMRD